jgi:hypothetical protein
MPTSHSLVPPIGGHHRELGVLGRFQQRRHP